MERSAGEDEIAENGGALTLAKRKKPAATDGASSSAAAGICDDTVGTILARLPARTAIACTALSKHHRSLIRSPEFRSLHCRLGAPLPSPHVAYLATAPIRRRPEHDRASIQYYGFHLAGSGPGLAGSGDAPIRSLTGRRYLGTKYINTCNGVLLFATAGGFSRPCRCTLWNPAIADAAREVTISEPPSSEKETSSSFLSRTCADRISSETSSSEDDTTSSEEERSEPVILPHGKDKELWYEKTQFLALGLGFGRRSNTYKLLLCRRDRYHIRMVLTDRHGKIIRRTCHPITRHFEYSLVVHSLGGDDEETLPLRTVLSMESVQSSKAEVKEEIIKSKSLYMEGTIYILYSNRNNVMILRAFNIDDEMVHTIAMPSDLQGAKYQLIEMSSHRPCLVTMKRHCIALWMLTADYLLEPIHVISYKILKLSLRRSIAGVWDCGSVLLFLLNRHSTTNILLLYDVTTKKIFRANMPCDLAVQKFDYMLCWGYKPTLVSPESVVGELNQDMQHLRDRSARVTDVINPLLQQDRRKGKEATLNIVCLMEFLVRILQKLPHDLQDVIEMPKMDSEEPGSLFQCVVSSD